MEKQTALVTGASRGNGRERALSLARDGFHVVINCRQSGSASDGVLGEIKKAGGSAELLCFDVSDTASSEVVSAWIEIHGPFYILVNNAGIRSDSLMAMMPFEDWRRVLDT